MARRIVAKKEAGAEIARKIAVILECTWTDGAVSPLTCMIRRTRADLEENRDASQGIGFHNA